MGLCSDSFEKASCAIVSVDVLDYGLEISCELDLEFYNTIHCDPPGSRPRPQPGASGPYQFASSRRLSRTRISLDFCLKWQSDLREGQRRLCHTLHRLVKPSHF